MSVTVVYKMGSVQAISPQLDTDGGIVLGMTQLNLPGRAYHRTLKLAHTIADLAGG